MNMENKQIGNWRIGSDLAECHVGTQVVLHFFNEQKFQGIFRGIDEECGEIKLQAIGAKSMIGLPLDKIFLWCEAADVKPIDAVAYPSDEPAISVADDTTYGGAHCYVIRECLGFNDGKTQYIETEQVIRFVQKNDDGSMIPGLQSEQLVLALLDRHEKLNARFPSEQSVKMIAGLRMFLEACEERVRNRMERGVMGELKK